MKSVLLIAVAIFVAACGHNPPVRNQNIPTVQSVSIEKSLLVPCKPIPELAGNTEFDLITWISEWKLIYLECKAGKEALVNSLKASFINSK